MLNDIQERRNVEYRQIIEDFKNKIADAKKDGLPCPHIPGVGLNYYKAKYKFAFCGIETYGWESLSDFFNQPIDELIGMTDKYLNNLDYLKWMSNDHATFWAFILKFFAKFYNIDFTKLKKGEYKDILTSFVWANCNSLERYEVSSKANGAEHCDWEFVKNSSKDFDNVNHIIDAFKPKVIFILNTKIDKENYFKDISILKDTSFENETRFIEFQSNSIPYIYYYDSKKGTHIFKLPHPTWIGLYSGIGFDKYIDTILNDIKRYSIWKKLPCSEADFEDTNTHEEINKSSMDYKRKTIASIAHYLVANDLVLSGNELRGLFNLNGIKTDYGADYAESGRGIYTLIRSTYDYYYNLKERQVAYEIARAFVNKDGEYAYE